MQVGGLDVSPAKEARAVLGTIRAGGPVLVSLFTIIMVLLGIMVYVGKEVIVLAKETTVTLRDFVVQQGTTNARLQQVFDELREQRRK